jgi:hypothetical protein
VVSLVLDAFKGHLTEAVKARLRKGNNDLAVIPGGMTSQLQPLDVSVNKPFKGYLKEECEQWLCSGNLPQTKTGKIKKAPASVVANWVSKAWEKIDASIIQKSFKKCCISNSLDGSEDDLVWESEDEEIADNISASEDEREETDASDSEDDE